MSVARWWIPAGVLLGFMIAAIRTGLLFGGDYDPAGVGGSLFAGVAVCWIIDAGLRRIRPRTEGVAQALADLDQLRRELAKVTNDWTIPVVVRSYEPGDDGQEDHEDEALLFGQHGYDQSSAREGEALTATYSKGTAGGADTLAPHPDEQGPLIEEVDLRVWKAALAAGLAMEPPRKWAPLDRHSGLWLPARQLFHMGVRSEHLSEIEEALALSYVNTRSAEEARDDLLLSVSRSRALEMIDGGGAIGRSFGPGAARRANSALDVLAAPLRALDGGRRLLNRAPFRIVYLGPMGLGDFVLTVGLIILASILLAASGLWQPGR